jgi:hypothetical protein
MKLQLTRSLPVLALAAALLLAGCAAPKEPLAGAKLGGKGPAQGALPASDPGGPAGGGRVLNTAPSVLSFAGSLAKADNGGGSVELFTATVQDDNAEADLVNLALVAKGPQRFAFSHAISNADLAHAGDPGLGPDGWAVWDSVAHDGKLQLAVQVKYPYGAPTGAYDWTLSVRDAAGAGAESAPDGTVVDPVHVVEVAGAVRDDGSPASADGWGGWSAQPGAQHVRSVTYLKVLNKGTAGEQRFIVDFSGRDFVGQQDGSWRVPLDGNVRFAAWEGEASQAPRDASFAWGPVSPDGSATLGFTRPGTVMFLAYEVQQVPSPLPSQVYYAGATVTAL